ncbi:Ig-like domain-containing protein [Ferruginibacter albus]|uniref:Ig-like domain-containing protein n=1 Tax=Ferruginibacter albus TaxID=2875540 RepID=UPI001CC784E2|nr:Ig-like domain-containing protein [Ferruginibacter albus]UAY52207.1 Ig-like domain-containing protein [Ferruginibacter albus]
MKSLKAIFYFVFLAAITSVYTMISPGCAQIGSPTGGPKDSIPPVLLKAVPQNKSTNFSGNKITLTFNEYINLDNVQNSLLVSPYPKTAPVLSFKLNTVTIKIKDTLKPNTTYTINLGDAIKDINENNPLKNFSYVFATGPVLDSLMLKGRAVLAETGKTDSTMLALLYRNANDSSVKKRKPDYLTRIASDGSFTFYNLPADTFALYILKDEDGSKTYNSEYEAFAFIDHNVFPSLSPVSDTLYAYAEKKEDKKKPATAATQGKPDKKFRFANPITGKQGLLDSIKITFNRTLKKYDPEKIILTDTLYEPIKTEQVLDSTRKILTIANTNKWKEDYDYKLIIAKDAATDSSDNELPKTDTISFKTKSATDYGTLLFRFSNIDASKHPVLLLLKDDNLIKSIPITGAQWSDKLFEPGDYELRILFDRNDNGKWDPGDYSKKLQPERVITLDKKLTIKANWDNERDIKL